MSKVNVVISPPPQPWDIDCSKDKGRTKKEFVKDCDVNEILKRCMKFKIPLPGPSARAAFRDVSEIGDFTTAMNRVKAAEAAFAELPPQIRSRFHNNASELIAFISDVANKQEAISLGLVAPELAQEPVSTPEPQAEGSASVSTPQA